MVLKEKKLAILIFLLRYGRMTSEEAGDILHNSRHSIQKDFIKLLEIPGVYSSSDRTILYSFYYIISHRIPVFYNNDGQKILLKDVKTKCPPKLEINSSSLLTLREYFA